jgi:signal transduction histidine kinase/CheY-like chemotaxis protein
MKRHLHVLFYCIITLFISTPLFTQNEGVIKEGFQEIDLTDIYYYSLETNIPLVKLSTTTFSKVPEDFKPQVKMTDTTWFKFTLTNGTQKIKNLTFTIGNVHFENYTLYRQEKQTISTILNFTKAIGDNHINFYLTPNESAVFYLKALHQNTNFHYDPKISDTSYFQTTLDKINLVSISFYGGLIFIFLFSIILSVYFKQTYLVAYALYVLFYGSFLSVYEGFFESIWFIDNRPMSGVLTITFILLSYIFNLVFLTSFLKTKAHFPILFLISRFLIFLLTILTLINFIPFVNDVLHSVIMLPVLISMIFIFTLIIVSFTKKIALANMVFYSYVWLMTFGILSLLIDYNIIPFPVNGKVLMKIGLFGELVMLTMAVVIFLFRVNDDLKDRLKVELTNSQKMNNELQEKQVELTYLSGIKDRFLVNISHEIRTPLNAILGTTTLLKSEELDNDMQNHINSIDNAGINLMTIIDDILSFKILTKEEIGVNVIHFNLSNEIDKISATFKKEAQKKKLFFDFYNLLDDPKITHKGDIEKILKSIGILLSNAIKYTKDGSVQITLSTIASTPKTDTIKIVIQDTGKGISEDMKKHIFDAFSQENESYSREFGGLGMGLAVFEKIMSKLNGEVIFESSVNEGSKFGFTLVLDKVKTAVPTINTSHTTETLNILVVEDEKINLFIAKQLLNKVNMNLNVIVAENGKIGVEKVMNEAIDFVFMDLQMPVMNGYEATELIRNLDKKGKSDIPIIALTAHTQNSERIKCKEYGMNDFLSKPYTIEELTDIIHAYVKK